MIKVLIVEDDTAIAEMYQIKCELSGISAKRASNGEIALVELESYTPDIVLLDLQMPEMDGAEFLQKFRKLSGHKETPVLILTNTGAEEAPRSLWEEGITGFVVKANCTPAEVINKIRHTIEEKPPLLQHV